MKIAKSVSGRPREANVLRTSVEKSADLAASFGAALSGVKAGEGPAAGGAGRGGPTARRGRGGGPGRRGVGARQTHGRRGAERVCVDLGDGALRRQTDRIAAGPILQ